MLRLLLLYCFILFSLIVNCQTTDPFNYTTTKEIIGGNGAVVSAHPLASAAGLEMLKRGGNAIDAAISTQLALAVVYPGAGNIGGGGFMIIHLKNGKNVALDFRETAPAKASKDMYLDEKGNPIMTLSQNGHLAAGVPGTIAGLFAAMKYASLDFKILIQPAIDLARKGFAITASQAASFNETKSEFQKYNFSSVAFVREKSWEQGDTLMQQQLASTLVRIRDKGAKGFYEGETAELLVQEMNKGKGIISLNDLKNYTAKEREITDFMYRGYRVLTMPLPSSGGIILEQMLKMIEPVHMDTTTFQGPYITQLMVEAERRAYADRAFYLGDPDFVKVPVKTLVSDDYIKNRMSDFVPGVAGKSKIIKEGNIPESMETTHYCVADKFGNAVSTTTTLNGSYGSKTVVSGAGFLLNNEMDDFSVKPGVPNMYGAVGNEKNAIAPGKRMLSSMTPTIVLKEEKPYIIVGTPGGTTIPTSVYQSLVNVIDFHMNANDAVNKPKFHHQWLPDNVFLEEGYDSNTKAALQKMGYEINPVDQIGRTEIILINRNKKGILTFHTVGDHRGDDAAAGY